MARHRHRRSGRATKRIRRFVATYGWRAYAVPVLTVLTIVTLLRPSLAGSSSPGAASGGPSRPGASAAASDIPHDLSGIPDDSAARGDAPSSAGATAPTAQRVLGVRGTGDGAAAPSAGARAGAAAGQTTGARAESLSDPGSSDGTGTSTAQTFVPTPNPADAWVCASNTHPTLVVVSIDRQQAWMCQGRDEVASTPVTTGNVEAGDATPTGTWTVQNKQTDRYLVGPGYRDYVHYWLPFHGDFGFHDASWQTFPFGSADYRTEGSHGCVHLPDAAMAWLYAWARVGSTMVTVEA